MLDGVAVEATEAIGLFYDLAVGFAQTGVKAVGNRCRVVGLADRVVVSLYLSLCEAFFIEVAGRSGDEVFALSLIYALGVDSGVEDYLSELFGICRGCALG